MFKLGGKKLFALCLLVKNVSAVNSANRCNFKESEKTVQYKNGLVGTSHLIRQFNFVVLPVPD